MSARPTNPGMISLQLARSTKGRKICWHNEIVVDESLAFVECSNCGEKLNPIDILVRFTMEQTRLATERRAHHAELECLKERRMTKCDHCRRLTKIRAKPQARHWGSQTGPAQSQPDVAPTPERESP